MEYEQIDSIDFCVWNSDEIRKYSVVEIKESKLNGDNTVNDDRLGVIQNYCNCVYCGCDNKMCPGHFGHIELNVPICHPKHTDTIIDFLTLYCHNDECNKLLIDKNEMELLGLNKYKKVTNNISKKFINTVDFIKKIKKICKYCFNIQPIYKYYEGKFYKCDGDKTNKIQNSPQINSTDIYKIFSKITNEDLNLINFPIENHPINTIMTAFPVVPKTVRPYVESGSAISDDDLTTKYIEIIKFNNKLAVKTLKETERNELITKLEFHIQTIIDNKAGKSRPINGRPYKCFSERLNSKSGRFRTNLTGKRGDYTARTVLGTDPYAGADEVVISKYISEKLTFPETVFCNITENNGIINYYGGNIKYLQDLVNKGLANFVIRKEIIKNTDGNIIDTKENRYDLKFHFRKRFFYKSNTELLDTDIIVRDNKKIEYNKAKNLNNFIILSSDKIYRNNKLLKNYKISEKINIDLLPDDLIIRHIDIKIFNKFYNNNIIFYENNYTTSSDLYKNSEAVRDSTSLYKNFNLNNCFIGEKISVKNYLIQNKKSLTNKYYCGFFVNNNKFLPLIINDTIYTCKNKSLDRNSYVVNLNDYVVINIKPLCIEPVNINELVIIQNDNIEYFNTTHININNDFINISPDILNNTFKKTIIKFTLQDIDNYNYFKGDKLLRNNIELCDFECKILNTFEIKPGDVVERQLRNGDYVLLGRQPTLHVGSMLARKVRIYNENRNINNSQKVKTLRINLSLTKSMNADMDGDELNIYAPQSYQARTELQEISSTAGMIKSTQNGTLFPCLCQDTLVFANYFTLKNINLSQCKFFDASTFIVNWNFIDKIYDNDDVINNVLYKLNHIQKVLKWKNPTDSLTQSSTSLYSFRNLFSLLLPNDFDYKYNDLIITRGVLLNTGIFNKTILGNGFNSIPHKLEKFYGAETCINFISNLQILSAEVYTSIGFSIGIDDCYLPENKLQEINDVINIGYIDCQIVEDTETEPIVKEQKISMGINNIFKKSEDIAIKSLSNDNALKIMVNSGAKGSNQNITQITTIIGQQNVEGKRIQETYGVRTLPHYINNKCKLFNYFDNTQDNSQDNISDVKKYESKGFVKHSFLHGMSPQEFFFQSCGGREGIIDTAIKTAKSGYIQRKLTKKMEDLKISYNNNFVVNANNEVIQTSYNDFDPSKTVLNNGQQFFTNIDTIIDDINNDYEFNTFN